MGLAAAVIGGGLIAVRPELWLVEHITFEGQQHATAAELRHLANLPNGTPIWSVYPPSVEHALEAHPWVRDAHVEVAWPSTVHLRVEEHDPVALLWDGGRLVYVDRLGAPFLPATPADLDYPHLTGFQPTREWDHRGLRDASIRAALALIDALDARRRVRRANVSEVAFQPASGFTVFAGPARLRFAPERFEQQLDRLDRLVADGVDLSTPVEIDLAPSRVAIVRDLTPAPVDRPLAEPVDSPPAPVPADPATSPPPSPPEPAANDGG